MDLGDAMSELEAFFMEFGRPLTNHSLPGYYTIVWAQLFKARFS